jgi:steroid delta-isomerase-like uncharacterized protein
MQQQGITITIAHGKETLSLSEHPQKGVSLMSTEDNKELLGRLTECWNQGNVALLEQLLAPDFIHHDPDRPDVRSREDYKRWLAESHSLFPDFHITVEDQVAEADKVAGRWTFRGTNTGAFETPAPLPATGKQVSVSGMSIFRFAAGKIVEEWFQEDTMGLMQQLGFLPVPEPAS